MTCANWKLTILAAVIFVFAMWPSLLSATVVKWITVIAAVLIIVIAWTIVDCKVCAKKKGKKRKK